MAPGLIVWEVYGEEYHRSSPLDVAPSEWVYEQPFWLITNAAVGGIIGGEVDPATAFPQTVCIDYIRVYSGAS